MKFYRLLLLMTALAFGILAAEAQTIPTTGYQVQAAAKRAFNQSTIFNDATNVAHLKLPFITSSKLGTDAMGNVVAVSDSGNCGGCTDCACLKTLVIVYDSIRLRTLYSNPDTVLHLTNTVANIVSVTMKSEHYGDTYDNMGELLAISDINVFKILSTEYSTLLNTGGYGVMGQKETGGTYSDSPKGIVIANNDADATSGRSKLTVTIYYNEQDTLGNPVNCGGSQPICSSCACIRDTMIYLYDTLALQNAHSTPITIMPAPGAGRYISVHNVYAHTYSGHTSYNNISPVASGFYFYLDSSLTNEVFSFIIDSLNPDQNTATIGVVSKGINQPMRVKADNDVAQGDTKIRLHIYYTIEDSLGTVVQNGGNCGVSQAYVDSLFEAAKLYACDSCSGGGGSQDLQAVLDNGNNAYDSGILLWSSDSLSQADISDRGIVLSDFYSSNSLSLVNRAIQFDDGTYKTTIEASDSLSAGVDLLLPKRSGTLATLDDIHDSIAAATGGDVNTWWDTTTVTGYLSNKSDGAYLNSGVVNIGIGGVAAYGLALMPSSDSSMSADMRFGASNAKYQFDPILPNSSPSGAGGNLAIQLDSNGYMFANPIGIQTVLNSGSEAYNSGFTLYSEDTVTSTIVGPGSVILMDNTSTKTAVINNLGLTINDSYRTTITSSDSLFTDADITLPNHSGTLALLTDVSSCACIRDTVIYLLDTIALQNANGSPITLLPAPGANKINNVHNIYISTYYRSTDYNNNSLGTANEFLIYYNSLSDGYMVSVQMSQSADSPLITSQVSAIGTASRCINVPLLWSAKSATSTGDATFKLHIYYTIEDFN